MIYDFREIHRVVFDVHAKYGRLTNLKWQETVNYDIKPTKVLSRLGTAEESFDFRLRGSVVDVYKLFVVHMVVVDVL